MSRKRLERVLSELAATADSLSENDQNLTLREVDEILEDAGYPVAELRGRLHSATRALAIQLRVAGVSVPNYLRETINKTAHIDVLAVHQPETARDQIRRAFKDLASAANSVGLLPPGSLVTARAYRKSGSLSTDDEHLLDEIEREVKGRAAKEKDDSNGGQEE